MGLVYDGQLSTSITLEGSNFLANGEPILSEVPANIVATPSQFCSADKAKSIVGCFVGFDVEEPKSRHVVPIGKLNGIRLMSHFRFKVWWSTHWVGSSGKDVENDTQMMMLDKNESGRPYVLLLPLLEGPFRASLQPGVGDHNVDICVESGSTQVCGSNFRTCLYMHVGDDPYSLVKEAMKVARVHLGTFRLLDEKTLPRIVDKFGWCTWDAFYLKVHPKGVWEGVKGLVEGGCPPGMVLIDDGWQSICHDGDPISDQEGINRTSAGEQIPCRLIKFEENYKFREYESIKSPSKKGIGAFIKDIKEEFKTIEHGLQMTMEDLAVDKIVSNGVGLVPPELVHKMYEGLHSHLESLAIDGVKVDVIHLLEMLAEEFGGRVDLAKAYYKALTASVKRHFKGKAVIASMQHCNDFLFLGTETISLGRVMISGALTPQATRTGHIGFRAATWCIVPTTACGWATSYNQIGTCSNELTNVLNSMPHHELRLVDLFM
ncbi:galactinol--sucrose galactosyltransferase-like [Herrania umbratica]|uniref:Galactinol--sucrose galactosyltransferase-like n=1 Tax=Herrania umbratica TaxID=108875 RepID=A0A6J1AZU1_9ROSI|nr:galactinol--sucrose galactosyltransferase-like [Herrania umbratica]